MGVGVDHGVTFNFGSAKVCSPAIFETYFSYDTDTVEPQLILVLYKTYRPQKRLTSLIFIA